GSLQRTILHKNISKKNTINASHRIFYFLGKMPEISLCKQMLFPAFFYFAIENMRIYFNTISPFVKQVIAKWMINYWQNVALRKIDITKSTAPPFNDLILNIINRNQYLVKS